MNEGMWAQHITTLVIQLAVNLVIGVFIAWFLGRKRVIGFGWSLFFCCVLSFLAGLVITMLSHKYKYAHLGPSKTRLTLGWVFIALGLFMAWEVFRAITTGLPLESFDASSVSAIASLVGGGIYLIKRSKGASFHSKNLVF